MILRLADGGQRAEQHGQDGHQDDDLLPLHQQMAERGGHDPHQQGDGGHLRRSGQERGDRRGRAFVDIRRPHVERHGGDLEGEAGDDEHEADNQPWRAVRRIGQHLGDLAELHGAGKAVDQGNAVQQKPRRQRPQDKKFQPGLGAAQLVAGEGGEHVGRQRLQFQPEIERHQVGGRGHHQHADGGIQHQHRKLEPAHIGVLAVVERENNAERGGNDDQHLDEGAEAVDREQPVIALAGVPGDDHEGDDQEGADREHGADEKTVALLQHADQQDGHAADRQHDLRQGEGPVHCGRTPGGSAPASLTAASSAAR